MIFKLYRIKKEKNKKGKINIADTENITNNKEKKYR